jgi:peptidoglycan hydrolase-like protein with peptidoglycan-binding domain
VGGVDGLTGPQTTQAVILFQKRRGLPATGSLDTITLNALIPTLPVCADSSHNALKGTGLSAVIFYRDTRAQDASALRDALTKAGLNTEAIASSLTEVHLDQEYDGTTYVIPSDRLADKGAALEDCVIKVTQSILPPNLAATPPLRRGGPGTIRKGDVVIYLY